jgi:hypothetical protein
MQFPWRQHPHLQGRFHPEHADELQIIIHQGGPRTSTLKPELVWVRVIALRDDVFDAQLLDEPTQLDRIADGARVRFVMAGGEYPVMVTDGYLAERGDWSVGACDGCGLSVLFDAPSELVAVCFPHLPEGATLERFTATCGACGGVQEVAAMATHHHEAAQPQRAWWKFR